MRRIIESSRERSLAFGVVSTQVASKRILEKDALMAKILSNRDLILVSEPIINQLYDFVRGSNFIAILTDAEGCILSMVGDEDILKEAHALKMIPGAYMDEGNIGTNAMGTALFLQEPVQVSGQEHVVEAYYKWTCSCAVIRDEHNTVIGALDLTGYKEGAHSHTLGMVVAAVRAVENTLKLQGKSRSLADQSNLVNRVLEMVAEGLLILCPDGKIQYANSQALDLMGLEDKSVFLKPSWHFIKNYEDLIEKLSKKDTLVDYELLLTTTCSRESVLVSASPVVLENMAIGHYVLKLSLGRNTRKLKQTIAESRAIYTFDKIISRSQKMKEIVSFAKQIADSRSTILITGESGTGKELFAHAIHNHSERRLKPFVVVNCASIPNSLIESELFGYEEGAFTGAKRGGNPGKFEVAEGGALFLDEIGDMPYAMQTRLLRVLQEGVICRVGSHQPKVVDVRLIAATNKNLSEAVSKGRFRLDLFYRLNVLPLHLPSLKERREDILPLVEFFSGRLARKNNRRTIELTNSDLSLLESYSWPGNIRELENVIEWRMNTSKLPACILSNPDCDTPTCIKDKSVETGGIASLIVEEALQQEGFEPLEVVERRYINQVYKALDFNLARTAKVLGLARNTVYKWVSKY